MSRECFINEISIATPKEILTNQDLENDFGVWKADEIFNKTGIKKRHIAHDIDVATMCQNAYESSSRPNDINYIILCTQNPDYKLPATSCIIQDKIGLDKSIGAIDVNQGCSGYVYSLSLAKGLISCGIADRMLVFTADKYSSIIDKNDRGNKTLFGDAATCTILSSEPKGLALQVDDFVFGTDGSGFDRLIVKNGGSKNSLDGSSDDKLYMNGKDIFTFTLKEVPKLVVKCNKKNKINNPEFYIFHQANKFMLESLRKKIGVPKNKFLYEIENYGNTVSSTIPIVIHHHNVQFLPDNRVILAGFGVGLSMAAVILTKF